MSRGIIGKIWTRSPRIIIDDDDMDVDGDNDI
jgi:hypothetical protein